MMDQILTAELQAIARAQRRRLALQSWTLCWAEVAVVTGIFLAFDFFGHPLSPPVFWASTVLLVALGAIKWMRLRRQELTLTKMARLVEESDPRLNSLLLAASEQIPDATTGQFSFLQQRVFEDAVRQNARSPWRQSFLERLYLTRATHALALGLMLALLGFHWFRSHGLVQKARVVTGLEVSPGNLALERGSSLAILATFPAPGPSEAQLVVKPVEDGAPATPPRIRTIPMTRSLKDPTFGVTIPEVRTGFLYEVIFPKGRSTRFAIDVFDYPELEKSDAHLSYPAYTTLPEKTVPDTRRVTAVEGSKVEWRLKLNKGVKSARWISSNQPPVDLKEVPGHADVYQIDGAFDQSRRWRLELVDAEGRTNKHPIEFAMDTLPNRPPVLKVAFPKGDQRISALQEVPLQAEAEDDFALGGYGVAWAKGGGTPNFVELGRGSGPHEKRTFQQLLAMEAARAEVGEMISWFAWAEDVGPDGLWRRTLGDMYFAEVRPFDEIFRQGSGGGGASESAGGGGQAQKLLELQKQIISATWKLQRSQALVKTAFKADASTIRDSQDQALQMARSLREKITDPGSQEPARVAVEKMQASLTELSEISTGGRTNGLPKALGAEQAAYQALLKLQAREYQITQSQKSEGGKGGESAGQRQQLDQLELKSNNKRYETQTQAATPQTAEQREQLQVLNRLKELAKRQEDLGERLKELQTALAEAKTGEEKEKLQRQLKRLKDEEREMVQDIDELQQRMNRPENQSRMAESRQKLDKTRDQAQKASEALDKNAVPEAVSSATRAQRDLKQLADDLRKASSNQFADDLREMRHDARDLQKQQEDAARQLAAESKTRPRSLSDSPDQKDLLRQFAQGQAGLTNLLEHMRQVTEQAETVEPLLSKQLYDTLRNADQDQTGKALEIASKLLERSLLPQASEVANQAKAGLDRLQEGVERAASGILGDEADALRQAKETVEQLGASAEKELAAVKSRQPSEEKAGSEASSKGPPAPDAAGQSDKQSSQESKNSQTSSAGKQPGQGQSAGAGQGNAPQGSRPERDQMAGNQGGGGDSKNQTAQGGSDQSNANSRRFFEGTNNGENINGGGAGQEGPITGENYAGWSDRLRDVEEMVDNPQVRQRVAAVRENARTLRSEFKKQGVRPSWNQLTTMVIQPLAEVQRQLTEELAKTRSREAVVPIDRDAVPQKYTDLVSRYYEELGRGSEAKK